MAEDLSLQHKPVRRLFARPASPDEWARYRLSDQQVEFYRQNGYLARISVLDSRQVDVLRQDLQGLSQGLSDPYYAGRALLHEYRTGASAAPFHAVGAWRVAPGLHDLLWNPAFAVPASQLLDGPVRFWYDELVVHPARDGGMVAWRQDYASWTRTRPMAHLTCCVALDDATRANGCEHYVSGSYRWGLLPAMSSSADMDAIQSVLSTQQKREFQPIGAELSMGQAVFHHPLALHGSFQNRTDRPYRVAVIHVMADGVLSDTNDPLLRGVPVIPQGEPIAGQFFPLLWDPSKVSA